MTRFKLWFLQTFCHSIEGREYSMTVPPGWV